MSLKQFSLPLFSLLLLLHCTVKKKNQNSSATSTAQTNTASAVISNTNAAASVSVNPYPMPAMLSYNYVPTQLHLDQFKLKYPQLDTVSLSTLQAGHNLYNNGACIKCHPAKNIVAYNDLQWARLIPDMSMRAHISEGQKDGLVKYIMAIRATATATNN